jgi:hypothetical protein
MPSPAASRQSCVRHPNFNATKPPAAPLPAADYRLRRILIAFIVTAIVSAVICAVTIARAMKSHVRTTAATHCLCMGKCNR